mmetsp:Transcript_3885/g.9272  ORF Transcript_3885/g.9272 Transcript_3885/m.9272 type:complete len:255 (+) Transcript_3885:161-925(+)
MNSTISKRGSRHPSGMNSNEANDSIFCETATTADSPSAPHCTAWWINRFITSAEAFRASLASCSTVSSMESRAPTAEGVSRRTRFSFSNGLPAITITAFARRAMESAPESNATSSMSNDGSSSMARAPSSCAAMTSITRREASATASLADGSAAPSSLTIALQKPERCAAAAAASPCCSSRCTASSLMQAAHPASSRAFATSAASRELSTIHTRRDRSPSPTSRCCHCPGNRPLICRERRFATGDDQSGWFGGR